jgi:methionyl-tRNA formyltransferase
MPESAELSGFTHLSPRKHPLRVLIVTENDPLYVAKFFGVFFDRVPREEIEICGLTVARAFHEPAWRTATRMWRFYGPFNFARLLGRFVRAKLVGSSIERLAREHDIRILPATSVNSQEYVAQIKALSPDVIVSVAAPEIFRKDILSTAKLGCINVHSGRLPRYRGMMPTFWQLLHGERHATITVHAMAAKLDAGDVLATQEFELLEQDSLDRVIVETKRAAALLMIHVLRQIGNGSVSTRPLNMADASYFSFPTPSDVKAFRARGHRLL